MGGRLWVDSAVGQGSRFHFTASFRVLDDTRPVQFQQGAADERDSICPPRSGDGLRILVAEDNSFNQRVIQKFLSKWGHQIVIAANGAEAVNAAQLCQFDAILMDVEMPVMDGLEATRQIRAFERKTGTHVPILALTAHAESTIRDRCLQSGMDDFVTKPISPDSLRHALVHFARRPAESDAAPVVAEATPGGFVDRTEFEARVGNDVDSAIELIDMFLTSAPEYLERVEQTIAEKDSEQIANAAHALKGQVGFFTSSLPFRAVRAIESAARNDDNAAAAKGLEELHQCWPAFTDELQRYRNAVQKTESH
jgi:CheY-like chemotaxis protein